MKVNIPIRRIWQDDFRLRIIPDLSERKSDPVSGRDDRPNETSPSLEEKTPNLICVQVQGDVERWRRTEKKNPENYEKIGQIILQAEY